MHRLDRVDDQQTRLSAVGQRDDRIDVVIGHQADRFVPDPEATGPHRHLIGGLLGLEGADIGATRAWSSETGSDAVRVAVADDGVEVDRILAFTFTERAAAEMRSRVRRELMARERKLRAGGDETRADELRRAARATERAWVMTIHAFCRRLLAQHPLAAGLDPRFRVLDASEAGRLADRAELEALLRPLHDLDKGVDTLGRCDHLVWQNPYHED